MRLAAMSPRSSNFQVADTLGIQPATEADRASACGAFQVTGQQVSSFSRQHEHITCLDL